MRLIIVRHGQTDDNAKDILSGQKGPGLNSTGKLQAERAAQFLQKEKIAVAYSSDQLRAEETAKIILKYHPKTSWHQTKKLRDRDFGNFNQKTETKARQEVKAQHSNWEDYNFKSGETFADVQKRVIAFYQRVLKTNPEKTVLFVSHGDCIASLIVNLLGRSIYEEQQYSPLNTAITILNLSSGKCKVELLDSIQHLQSRKKV